MCAPVIRDVELAAPPAEWLPITEMRGFSFAARTSYARPRVARALVPAVLGMAPDNSGREA
jgi:hypothetical protein